MTPHSKLVTVSRYEYTRSARRGLVEEEEQQKQKQPLVCLFFFF